MYRGIFSGALAALLLGSAVAAAATASLPPEGEVDVYRDRYGVPHIYAARESDAFYALGYAQAEDSAENILIMALVAEGRSAAAFGSKELPWSGPALIADKEALRWRIAEQAKAAYEQLPPHLKAQFDSYTAGFLAYLAEHPDKVPAWAPRLEPWHSVAWPHAVLWFYAVGDGLRKCAQDGAKLAAAVAHTAEIRSASNEWAIGPGRTANGQTFLLSDPHGEIPVAGNPFYEYRMKTEGLDVTGFAFGLAPALVHSPKVAWGLTTGGPDVSDCYRLEVEGNRYRLSGRWLDFEVRQHTIEVADAAPVKVEYRYAYINDAPAPVVAEQGGVAYAVSTPYWGHLGEMFVQFDGMIRANDAEGVLEAAEVQGIFVQNILIADAKGSIIYVRAGRTPRRHANVSWDKALPGNDPASQWDGIHELRDLVTVRNPAVGYLQNNNTSPDLMVKGAPLVKADDYPAYIWNVNPALTYKDRASRANEVLDAARGFDLEDAQRLALDEKWFGSEQWTALLTKAASTYPKIVKGFDADAKKVLERLKAFDGFARSDSVAALNHHAWRSALYAAYGKDHLQDLRTSASGNAPSKQAMKAALAAVPAAAARLRERLGSVDRPYGDWFRIGRGADRHYPLGGGVSLELDNFGRCTAMQAPDFLCSIPLRAFGFQAKAADGRQLVTHGSRALRLVMLGPEFASFSVRNFGQSDDPKSPHWDDQARELSSQDRLKRIPFTLEELVREQTSRRRLVVDRAE